MLVPVVHAAGGLTLARARTTGERSRRASGVAPTDDRRLDGRHVHRSPARRARTRCGPHRSSSSPRWRSSRSGAAASRARRGRRNRSADDRRGRRLVLGLSFDHRVCEPVAPRATLSESVNCSRAGPRERALGAAAASSRSRLLRRGERPAALAAAGARRLRPALRAPADLHARRADARGALPRATASLDAVVIDADRGGDVTYHAPGQVVAWAIVDVDDDPAAGKAHVERLEDAVTATVRRADPEGRLGEVGRLEGYPGVWANLDGACRRRSRRSACAPSEMNSVTAAHSTASRSTWTIDLAGFRAIVPCGIPDKPVASLRSLGVRRSPRSKWRTSWRGVGAPAGGGARVARVDRTTATHFERASAPSTAPPGRRRSRRGTGALDAQARVVARRGAHGTRVSLAAPRSPRTSAS